MGGHGARTVAVPINPYQLHRVTFFRTHQSQHQLIINPLSKLSIINIMSQVDVNLLELSLTTIFVGGVDQYAD
jgi:hypothetical protein